MATPVITIQPPSAEVDVVVRNNTPFSERVWQAILKLLDATQLARLSRVRTSIDSVYALALTISRYPGFVVTLLTMNCCGR